MPIKCTLFQNISSEKPRPINTPFGNTHAERKSRQMHAWQCAANHDTGKKCNEYLIENGLLLDALGNAQNKLNTNISFVFESVMDFAE